MTIFPSDPPTHIKGGGGGRLLTPLGSTVTLHVVGQYGGRGFFAVSNWFAYDDNGTWYRGFDTDDEVVWGRLTKRPNLEGDPQPVMETILRYVITMAEAKRRALPPPQVSD